MNCTGCVGDLPEGARFCQSCGKSAAAPAPQSTSATVKSYAAAGSATGCLFGAGTAFWSILLGALLCCTGIGAIFGVPLILVGLGSPVAGSLVGAAAAQTFRGPCPHCRQEIDAGFGVQGLNCPACAKRIMVQQVKGKPKERTFVPVV